VTLKRIASNAQTRRDSASAERWESYCQWVNEYEIG
jgi:hypothetical protein